MKRRRLLAAMRERMRHDATVRESEDGGHSVPSEPPPPFTAPLPAVEPNLELEQLAAEARYHRDRFDLYRARVISGSSAPTSSARCASSSVRPPPPRRGLRTPAARHEVDEPAR